METTAKEKIEGPNPVKRFLRRCRNLVTKYPKADIKHINESSQKSLTSVKEDVPRLENRKASITGPLHFNIYRPRQGALNFVRPFRGSKKTLLESDTATVGVPNGSGLPFHQTLLGQLPRELRDMIYSEVFANNGIAFVHSQLRGNLDATARKPTVQLKVLATCRQFFDEAYTIAYRSTCFYYFAHQGDGLDDKLTRYSPRQRENVRHIASWSNPYVPTTLIECVPPGLTIRKLTVNSNYMSGAIDTSTVQARVAWFFDTMIQWTALESMDFLTGCASWSTTDNDPPSDRGAARDVRGMLRSSWRGHDQVLEVKETESGPDTFEVLLKRSDSKPIRKVKLVIASIYELDAMALAAKKSEGIGSGSSGEMRNVRESETKG